MWCSYIKHTCVNTHKKGSWRKRKYIITGSDVVHGHQDQQRDNILALSKNSFHSLYYLLGVVWDKPLLLISQTYARICHHTVTTFSHVTRTMASSAAKGVVADRRETYRVMVPKLPLKKNDTMLMDTLSSYQFDSRFWGLRSLSFCIVANSFL